MGDGRWEMGDEEEAEDDEEGKGVRKADGAEEEEKHIPLSICSY